MEMTLKERLMAHTLDEGLKYLDKNPEANIPKLMSLISSS